MYTYSRPFHSPHSIGLFTNEGHQNYNIAEEKSIGASRNICSYSCLQNLQSRNDSFYLILITKIARQLIIVQLTGYAISVSYCHHLSHNQALSHRQRILFFYQGLSNSCDLYDHIFHGIKTAAGDIFP